MTHTINEEELSEWLLRPQWQIYASSGSRDGAKRLEIDSANNTHVFRVVVHGDVVFLGADKGAAVAAYNNAR